MVIAWFSDANDQRDRLHEEGDRERRHQHHGRRLTAQRAEDDAIHREREGDDDAEASGDAGRDGPPRGVRKRVGADHHELAVREVDEPEHAEDEPDPHGHQGVDCAESDGVREGLEVERGEDHEAR